MSRGAGFRADKSAITMAVNDAMRCYGVQRLTQFVQYRSYDPPNHAQEEVAASLPDRGCGEECGQEDKCIGPSFGKFDTTSTIGSPRQSSIIRGMKVEHCHDDRSTNESLSSSPSIQTLHLDTHNIPKQSYC